MKMGNPNVAGLFYPADPEELQNFLVSALKQGTPAPPDSLPVALIVPHAGYIYSGFTAGHAFARVQHCSPGRIVLLGVSHRYRFPGISLYSNPEIRSPIGTSPVDIAFTRTLQQNFECVSPEAHEAEHALEVQIPFIQHLFKETPVIPVLFGMPPSQFHLDFGKRLAQLLDEKDLVIASTDFSHYLPLPEAEKRDRQALSLIEQGDLPGLIHGLEKDDFSLCGASAVVAALAFSETCGAEHRYILDYSTSGDRTQNYESVVGYGAVSLER